MSIEFKNVSDFKRGILYEILTDAYSFDYRYKLNCDSDWREFESFFFDNLQIADKYGFITTLHGVAIGFVFWDPRNMPEYAEIGHNCIASKHKGYGYGKMQLQEAVSRITRNEVNKILVSTNDDLIPAQKMYESVGFTFYQKRKNQSSAEGFHEHIDYVYYPREKHTNTCNEVDK